MSHDRTLVILHNSNDIRRLTTEEEDTRRRRLQDGDISTEMGPHLLIQDIRYVLFCVMFTVISQQIHC
jgi:hypothetical protein